MAKYRVYGNYVFSKVLGEYEAESEKEAIEMALKKAEADAILCVKFSKEFVDSGALDKESFTFNIKLDKLNS